MMIKALKDEKELSLWLVDYKFYYFLRAYFNLNYPRFSKHFHAFPRAWF